MRINLAKVKEEEALDGKYLLSTSDDTLSAEDVALGYKQLEEVERAFRTLKTTRKRGSGPTSCSAIWPCFWSGSRSGKRETWDRIRPVMERCHLGEFSSKDGLVFQRTEMTSEQVDILMKLIFLAERPPPPEVSFHELLMAADPPGKYFS